MNRKLYTIALCIFLSILSCYTYGNNLSEIHLADSPFVYHWSHNTTKPIQTIENTIAPPPNFKRKLGTDKNQYNWYRQLPLKPIGSEVLLYNNSKKNRQDVHQAIIDIDVGNRDLQQCADAVMRLRAEYLYSQKKFENISFNFTNGQNIPYSKWREGNIIKFKENKAYWTLSGRNQKSYTYFRKYMNLIFAYAGTHSLSKELSPLKNIDEIDIGDVFIYGGFPGHAILVVDVAENDLGDKSFLLAQSYMPAQNIHILKNFSDANLSPWYSLKKLKKDKKLFTPEWTFDITELKRFK